MNRYHLTHVTEFLYEGPVSESYNEVRLRPMHDERQSCLSFTLTTSPRSIAVPYRDAYGNWAHQFNVLQEHSHLRIVGESTILVHDSPSAVFESMSLADFDSSGKQLCDEYLDFVAPTTYVPHLSVVNQLVDVVGHLSGGTVLGFAQSASDLIHQRFRYVKGATQVQSSIEDALSLGAGVCQDFAHLLLGVVRMRGIPGRYVSGYLVPQSRNGHGASLEEVIGGQASHAWTEVYIPGGGWLGLDPTLGAPVGLRHVRVAYGRDYGDVPPVRGLYKGAAGQRLSVDVRVRPVLNDDGCEQLQETVAKNPSQPSADRAQQPAQQQQ
ncbi:MAG TPA: transglutaminase family protein [Terriglobales bacterium]|nr:transglutaminase family protein [Terriglobales bacterium]